MKKLKYLKKLKKSVKIKKMTASVQNSNKFINALSSDTLN